MTEPQDGNELMFLLHNPISLGGILEDCIAFPV